MLQPPKEVAIALASEPEQMAQREPVPVGPEAKSVSELDLMTTL